MPRTLPVLFPGVVRVLTSLGERVRLARLRRRYSAADVAARAGITRSTLYRVEQGEAGVALGTYVSVLKVLGLDGDLDAVAKDDVLGQKLQDLQLPIRRKAPRKGRVADHEGEAAAEAQPKGQS
jgi:transcriptional regulator with XRE-family HTH domain